MRYYAWIVLASLMTLGAGAAPCFAGSIFDEEWDKTHPTGSAISEQPAVTPVPQSPTPEPATVVSKPLPQPTPQSAAAAVPASVRFALPDTAAQKEAQKLVDEVFSADIAAAKTAEQKEVMAKKLLEIGDQTQKYLAARFVLWRMARDLAAEAGKAETALHCADEIGRGFQADAPAMKAEVAVKLLKSIQHQADYGSLVSLLKGLMDEAVAADRLEVARQIGDLSLSAAYRSEDAALVRQATVRARQIREIEAAHVEVKKALAVLEKTPVDPAANLSAGKYCCFMKGDWKTGLPMLALGNDATVKALAAQEIAGVSGADAKMAIGDGWWDVGEKAKGLPREQLRQHAAKWYQAAVPDLSGLAKVKVEKRLASLTTEDSANSPRARSNWFVIFRSPDPSIWNKDVDNNDKYAVSLKKVPADIKWLKLAVSRDDYVIISISSSQLGAMGTEGRYRWNGTNQFDNGGYHLGIVDSGSRAAKGEADISHMGDRGWGFGNDCFINDNNQMFGWNGKVLSATVFEISVQAGDLSPDESAHLLK